METKDWLRNTEQGLAKFYNSSEHLAEDMTIVKFKGRVVFKQYILKKRKCFGIKI